jgi:hypothetical protein
MQNGSYPQQAFYGTASQQLNSNEWKESLNGSIQPIRTSAGAYDSTQGQQPLMDIASPHSLNGVQQRGTSLLQYQVPIKPMFGMQGVPPQSAGG